jgi:hypothetical protein
VIVAFVAREDGVGWGQFAFGVAVGVVGMALLPTFAFYVLGRLVQRPWLLGLLFLIGTAVVGTYSWLVVFLFALGVACEPGCLE